jgi:hypothetical protein
MFDPISSYEINEKRGLMQQKVRQNNMANFLPPIGMDFIQHKGEGNYKKVFGSDDGHKVLGVFNDFGCRSDDFKKDHGDKLHVLFAGCSFTYGEGMPIETTWSYLVNKYINENIAETSGHFNIGKGGANFETIVNQIIGYMNYAGKPDVIFILLPEIGREFLHYMTQVWPMNKDSVQIPGPGEVPSTFNNLRERLVNFKSLCNLMDIKLVVGCWAMNIGNHMTQIEKYVDPFKDLPFDVIDVAGGSAWLHSFREDDLGHPEIEKEILDSLDINDPFRKLVYLALDDAHPGLLGHKIITNYFVQYLDKSDILHKK